MNYTYQILASRPTDPIQQIYKDELEEQLKTLMEWKNKARIQLEYFRTACRMYNLCDIKDVNALLSN